MKVSNEEEPRGDQKALYLLFLPTLPFSRSSSHSEALVVTGQG